MVLAEELREEIEELKGDSLSDLANKPKRILSGIVIVNVLHERMDPDRNLRI